MKQLLGCLTLLLIYYLPNVNAQIPLSALYVSPTGNDTNPGTKKKPLASLAGAQQSVRRLIQAGRLPANGMTVWFENGRYAVPQEGNVFTEADSGNASSPITYRALPKATVQFSGGIPLAGSDFRPVTDSAVLARLNPSVRAKVVQLDLTNLKIADLGLLKPFGFPRSIQPTAPMLIVNGSFLPIARYPNTGFIRTGTVLVTDSARINRGATFQVTDSHVNRWSQETDGWAQGYWMQDWADDAIPIANVDVANTSITLGLSHSYGVGANKRFYVFNLLSELDQPGEWYIDRKTQIVYIYPSESLPAAMIELSLTTKPVLALNNTANLIFDGIEFTSLRGGAIHITGGHANTVRNCQFHGIGNQPIVIKNGRNHTVMNCTITNTDMGGIDVSGGDRPTLTGSGHRIVNNQISDYSVWRRTYCPAINVSGVGIQVAHNLLHHAPHSAIIYGGNNHLIEFNEIHDVCQETNDAGAIYMGRDWTARGHILRYNYIHHIPKFIASDGKSWVHGIYLDDMASGISAYGNVCYKLFGGATFLLGGGRDNQLTNNILIDCAISAVLDSRGINWNINPEKSVFRDRLDAMPYQSVRWRQAYPTLPQLLTDAPTAPKGNIITGNLLIQSGPFQFQGTFNQFSTPTANQTIEGTFQEQHFSESLTREQLSQYLSRFPDFPPIPFTKIGLER